MTNYSPTILYIDDESDQRMFLAALLEYRGYGVRTARGALDALELIVTERFDAVIVDYELPDMTGAQLAQEIRALEPSARIILFSGRPHLPAGELTYVDAYWSCRQSTDLINPLRLDRQREETYEKLVVIHCGSCVVIHCRTPDPRRGSGPN